MNSHKRLWNMTKTEGAGGQNYSQDCSICLNSIAVSLEYPSSPISLALRLLLTSGTTALPVSFRGALFPHVALQMHS